MILRRLKTHVQMVARLNESFDIRDAAIKAFVSCEAEDQRVQTVETAIALMQSDIVPPLVSNMTDELAQQERHTTFLSPEFLVALNRHNGEIDDEINQLNVNFGLMWASHIVDHPEVGLASEGADVGTVRVVIDSPFDELCADKSFKRDLITTNVWHESTRLRLDRFKGWSEVFRQSLGVELESLK